MDDVTNRLQDRSASRLNGLAHDAGNDAHGIIHPFHHLERAPVEAEADAKGALL